MASQCIVLMPIIAIGILHAVAVQHPVAGLYVGGFWTVVLLVLGLLCGRWIYRKAEDYERAKAHFLRRKKAARAEYEAEDQAQPDETAS